MAGTNKRAKTPAVDKPNPDPQGADQTNQQAPAETAAVAAITSAPPALTEGATGESSADKPPVIEPEPKPESAPESLPAPTEAGSTALVSAEPEPETQQVVPASPVADLLAGALGDFIRAAGSSVLEERVRQVVVEGHSPEDDQAYSKYQLERAAVCYAGHAAGLPRARLDLYWPFHPADFKPSETRRQTLVKAGALILAAIEAIDRAEAADS